MRGLLQRLRQKIVDRDYYLSSQAEDERLNDALEGRDVESAILNGRLQKRLARDPRGARSRRGGAGARRPLIHVICRLDESNRLRVITVYALTGEEE